MSKRLIYAEDAIDALHDEIVRRRIDEDTNDDGALDEFDTEAIIKDLPSAQPQSCKDAVSKADVLETYAELYDVFDDNKEIKNELHKIYDKINALQAAQPQRMKGKWIRHDEIKNVYGGICIECSECGEKYVVQHVDDEKYCRNCGADMRGEQDD